jgi:hypothetical protein
MLLVFFDVSAILLYLMCALFLFLLIFYVYIISAILLMSVLVSAILLCYSPLPVSTRCDRYGLLLALVHKKNRKAADGDETTRCLLATLPRELLLLLLRYCSCLEGVVTE